MLLPTAYSPDYFAIDDILVSQERVPCTLLHDVPKLGKLNHLEEEQDIKSGVNLELPMWLALDLSVTREPTILANLPKVYKDSYHEILKADPCAVNMHKFGSHFYELGFFVKQFDAKGSVAEMLLQTFTSRFRLVMDLADEIVSDPYTIQKLDVLEKNLLRSAHESKMKLVSWLMLSERPLNAAGMVINHKKRKRVDDDLFN